MQILNISLEDDLPTEAAVIMTRDEMIYLATVTGRSSGSQADEVMTDGCRLNIEIHSTLVGSLFNRFWEDGVDGARRGDTQ